MRSQSSMSPSRDSLESRFWSKVDKSGDCWTWQAWKSRDGYGLLKRNGWGQGAHRISWELTHGPIPDGMCVLHRCDNPPCVRPSHLFLGTQADNVHDMLRKGRGVPPASVGESNANTIFTEADIRWIRATYRPYVMSYRRIAEIYGVHEDTIARIIRRRYWSHID